MPILITRKKQRGFTLLELMLVIVVIVAMAIAGIRLSQLKAEHMQVDHTAMQMQQLLESATTYYIQQYNAQKEQNAGSWPGDTELSSKGISDLLNAGLLPQDFANKNSWGYDYEIGPSTGNGTNIKDGNLFLVKTEVPTEEFANLLRSRMPMGSVALNSDGTHYDVTASINIPSYNYNNARAINNATYVHPGDCVDLPPCPSNMSPSVTLAPVGVYGFINDTSISGVQGFTLYKGNNNGSDSAPCQAQDISSSYSLPTCIADQQIRACIHISAETSTGSVQLTQNMAQNMYIMALTQCIPGANQQQVF